MKTTKGIIRLAAVCCLTVTLFAPGTAQAAGKEPKNPEPTALPLPKFYARHVEEGNKLLAVGKYKEALDEFFLAKEINPDYYPTYIGFGKVYIARGELKKAVENYQKAINLLSPSYANDHVKRGDYFASKGVWQKALDDYWEVLRIDPQAGVQYTLAMKHLRFGNEKAAIKAFELAAKIDDDYADPHFQLGNIYYKGNNLKKALPEYALAVKYDPRNPRYNYYLGNVFYKNGASKKKIDAEQMQQAIEYLEKAILYGVRERNAHFNLGSAYLIQGEYDAAIRKFQDCIRLKLKDQEVFYNMGNAYYQKAMQIPYKWDGRSALLDAHLVQQNDTKFNFLLTAIMSYKEALKFKQDYTQVHFDLGVAYYRLSELKPTAQWLNKIINKSNAKDYYQKGSAFFKTDMSMLALRNFQAFVEKTDNAKMKKMASQVMADIQKEAGIAKIQ